jgi:outer membrane receptor protein involved in Fe transport
VLRGPQGTLYGASSLGGLLKFVTVDPSTDALSGRVQLGTSSVHNSDGLGYNLRGSVNSPVSETLAVRASGFTRQEPGYIDVPNYLGADGQGKDGVNDLQARGGQVAALWRPSDRFSLKLSALLQRLERDGASFVNVGPGFGDLQQLSLRGTGSNDTESRFVSANLKADFGVLEVTSVTGYTDNTGAGVGDLTAGLGELAQEFFQVGGAASSFDIGVQKFSQELRVSAPLGARFEALVGAFYTHEATSGTFNIPALDPATGQAVGLILSNTVGPTRYDEYAAFATLTWHVSDRFDLQVGGRESHNRQIFNNTFEFVAFGEEPFASPTQRSRDQAFTYLVTPQLKLSPDLMLYARLASGYRPGGSNELNALLPARYEPDTTRNYEIGVKGNVFDHS